MSVVLHDSEKNLYQVLEASTEQEVTECHQTSKLVEEEEDEYIVVCDNCNDEINCIKNNIYCLSKKEMEMTICQYCFDDLWREMRFDGWECDDFSQQSEAEK